MPRKGHAELILDRIDFNGAEVDPALGPCWLWMHLVNEGGYPIQKTHDTTIFVHRYMYEHLVGSVSEGFELDHLCRVRNCCNPGHLEPVTPRINQQRSNSFAGLNARKTHCIHGHEFTPENTYFPPKRPNRRQCRACVRERARALYWRTRSREHTMTTATLAASLQQKS